MGLKKRYELRKAELLRDSSICEYNRKLFQQFFEYLERKLKRINGLPALDNATYKTLTKYLYMLPNVNFWFSDRPWNTLTKQDIQRVYDDLEDGNIKSLSGRIVKCRSDYYNRIFKSKPFRLAGKSELAKEVIEYYRGENTEVRIVSEKSFRHLVNVVSNPRHLLLMWLEWDYGENINSLLQLEKSDFVRQVSRANGEPEYLLHLRKEILKRSRRSRTEPSLYPETVQLLDMVLSQLNEHDRLFEFGYRQAFKFFKAAVKRSGIKCEPNGENPSWKDLRSGMASHLLKSGWTIDEINSRLGHKPGSPTFGKRPINC